MLALRNGTLNRARTLQGLLVCGVALAASAAMAAASLSGAEAAKDRQAHMKEMGKAAKAIGAQLHDGKAEAAVVQPAAQVIASHANELPHWFPKGSGKESGAKTHALALIWSEPADFAIKAKALQAAAPKLLAVAGTGDLARVGPAMKEVGGTCKGCHEKFEEKHDD